MAMKAKTRRLSPKSRLILLLVGMPLLLFGGLFAQSTYLDRQNVSEMKELLAAFESLKQEAEEKTGDSFSIEADCGSVGKFADSYSCELYLKNPNGSLYDYSTFINQNSVLLSGGSNCRVVDGAGAKYFNFFSCSVSVRESSRSSAETIFFEYDTSPGRAF